MLESQLRDEGVKRERRSREKERSSLISDLTL
jgi:hypothetical protein